MSPSSSCFSFETSYHSREDRGVVPVGVVEGRGHDVLGQAVQPVRQRAAPGRPPRGEELVAAPTQQQSLGAQRLLERELGPAPRGPWIRPNQPPRRKPSSPVGSWTTPSSETFSLMTIFPIVGALPQCRRVEGWTPRGRRTGRPCGTLSGVIYKLLTTPEWEAAREAGEFRGSAVDLADGYLHFSDAWAGRGDGRAVLRRPARPDHARRRRGHDSVTACAGSRPVAARSSAPLRPAAGRVGRHRGRARRGSAGGGRGRGGALSRNTTSSVVGIPQRSVRHFVGGPLGSNVPFKRRSDRCSVVSPSSTVERPRCGSSTPSGICPRRPGRGSRRSPSTPTPTAPRPSSARRTSPTRSAPPRPARTSTTPCWSGRWSRPAPTPRGSAGASSPRTRRSPSCARRSASPSSGRAPRRCASSATRSARS